MASLKRTGKMTTLSVSVSPETKARLRKAADRACGGSVSALIEAMSFEAERWEALDWLIRRAPPIDHAAFESFMKEMVARKRKRRPKSAA